MAQYRIALDLVALDTVIELLEIKRRCMNDAARMSILQNAAVMNEKAPGSGDLAIKSVKILERRGLSTLEACEALTEIFNLLGREKYD